MKIVILKTGLLPNADTLEEAITQLAAEHEIQAVDTSRPDLSAQDWDRVVNEVVAADRVLTV